MITPEIQKLANRVALKKTGCNRATKIVMIDGEEIQTKASQGVITVFSPTVVLYDSYHAESRTGIRASMAALKRFWSTYHYVPTKLIVAIPDVESIYNNDTH